MLQARSKGDCHEANRSRCHDLEMARAMGVWLIPCQMTMDLLGISREDLVDGVEEPAGATTALLEAQDAMTLFI